MLGKTLRSRYKIIKQLGSRRFCDIYLAKDEDLPDNPLCVVKQLKPKNLDPLLLPTARKLFTTEAEVLYRLGKHDQIPQLYAQFEEDEESYLVQEFIAGNDLIQELIPGRQWSEAEVIILLKDILEILAFVHQNNVIHRDIKPTNLIRRRQDGKIVMIDFGSVKKVSSQLGNIMEQTNLIVGVGTQGYMPNEQGNGNPKFSSDIYAVGVIGIQALTGTFPPVKDNNTHEINWRNQVQVNPKLAVVLDKMVLYDFRQRYQSAEETLQALKDSTSSKPQPLRQQRSQPEVFAIIGLLVTVVAGIASLIIFPQINTISDSNNSTNVISQPQANANKVVEYIDTADGIKIKYPENWQKKEAPNLFTGEVVTFLPPEGNNADTSLSIRIEDLSSQPLDLDEYTKSSIKEITSFLKGAKIIDSSSSTLANKSAYTVSYTGKNDRSELINHLEIWTVKNKKAYIISYKGEPEQFANYLKTVEVMISSFEIN